MAIAVETALSLHTNNDNESNWSGTDGADTYNVSIQGTNSESWQISKNSTETGTLTLSRDLSGTNSMFLFWMKSDLSYYYTSVKIQLVSSISNYREYTLATSSLPNVSGDFKSFALDVNSGGTETGTFAPGSLTYINIILDNSSSGNIRSVINTWIDAMWYGTGLVFSGSSAAGNLMFKEAALLDDGGSEYGALQYYNGKIFVQHNITFDDNGSANTQNSTGETMVFKDTDNGISTYTFKLIGTNNTVVFNGTSVEADGSATVNFDSSGTVSSFDMTGGNIKGAGTTAFKSGQDIDGVVLTSRTSVTVGGCNFTNNTINTSGLITVTSAGSFANNKILKASGTVAVSIADLDDCDNNYFLSDGTGHAVDLVTIPAGDTMGWNCVTSGFDSGSTGSPVTPTNTGNEDIYVSASSGTITISVASGATIPSIKSAGATVNVVAGLLPITITVKDSSTGLDIPGANVMILREDTKAKIISGTTDANGEYSESVASTYNGVVFVGWARQMDLANIDYVQKDFSGTISSNGADINVSLDPI